MTEIDGVMLCIFRKYFEQTSTQEWSKWSVKKTNKKSNTGKRKWIRMGIVEDGYRLTGNV